MTGPEGRRPAGQGAGKKRRMSPQGGRHRDRKGAGYPGGVRRVAYGSAVLAGDGGVTGDRPAPA